ncbi:MAG: PTS glucitol/sorbitol transporter subunit IIA [Clostridiaceae bacterium]
MDIIYETEITRVGNEAKELIKEEMFIIFKEDVPEYLADYCFLHNENNLVKNIELNDVLLLGESEYKVVTVGSVVNANLKELGHITFKFTGIPEDAVPGTLYLEQKEIVPPASGTKIKIIRA